MVDDMFCRGVIRYTLVLVVIAKFEVVSRVGIGGKLAS